MRESIDKLYTALRRKTSSGRYIPEIDGIRFFAILPVFLHHFLERITRHMDASGFDLKKYELMLCNLLPSGKLGVELFFIVSGMVISLPIIKGYLYQPQKFDFKYSNYIAKRFTRLEPPYIIVMSICLLGVLILSLSGNSLLLSGTRSADADIPLINSFLSSIFYMHGILHDSLPKLNPVAWSLEIEFQFYILAPFILMSMLIPVKKLNQSQIYFVAVTVMGAFLLRTACNLTALSSISKHLFLNYIHFFMAGFILSVGFLSGTFKGGFFKKHATTLFAAGTSLALAVDYMRENLEVFNALLSDSLLTMGLMLFFSAVLSGGFGKTICSNKILTTIGGMCYSIYLIHLIFLQVGVKTLTRFLKLENLLLDGLLYFSILTPLLLLTSALFFVFIEKPCMDHNWIKNLKKPFQKQTT